MATLVAGLILFLGLHSVRIVAEGPRTALIDRLGENGWKIGYSVLALAGLWLVVRGYGQTRAAPDALWNPPTWTRHLSALLTVPAFVLLVAAYLPGNRIKTAVGHPMIIGVALWALAHLLANGRPGDVLLFGAFLVWAVLDWQTARRRDPSGMHSGPAAAHASGGQEAGSTGAARVRPGGTLSRDLLTVAIGLVAWAAFAFWLHARWIGVRPFG